MTIAAGDALRPDSIHDIFTIIVSNPPYITAQEMTEPDRSVDAYEPHLALYGGTDGLDFYRAMAQHPAFSLAPGGLLFAECGWKQGEQAAQLFRQAGWNNVHLREDLREFRGLSARKKQIRDNRRQDYGEEKSIAYRYGSNR